MSVDQEDLKTGGFIHKSVRSYLHAVEIQTGSKKTSRVTTVTLVPREGNETLRRRRDDTLGNAPSVAHLKYE